LSAAARPLLAVGWSMIVAGGCVAAINSATPFAHGSWVAAYLVLVGGVAQVGLASGRPPSSQRLSRAELALWNGGNAGVVAGVLAGLPGLVSLGSLALLIGLLGFALDARRAAPSRRGLRLLLDAGVVGLAASVVVGSALAGAPPGSWL
jgi:hypothetical protein